MDTKQIKEIIDNACYNYFGIRSDSEKYAVGDDVRNSHQLYQDPVWKDQACNVLCYPYIETGPYKGYYDGGPLNGTCAIDVTPFLDADEDRINRGINRAIHAAEQYNGEYLYLIAGDRSEYGNDDGEVIIQNAVVLSQIK